MKETKMALSEKVIIENISILDVFNENFINKLNSLKRLNEDLFPAAIVFVSEIEKDGKKQAYPLIFSHQSVEEVKSRKLHIESPNTDLLTSVTKLMEVEKNE